VTDVGTEDLRRKSKRLDGLTITKTSGVDSGANGLDGWAVIKAGDTDSRAVAVLEVVKSAGIGLDVLVDELLAAGVTSVVGKSATVGDAIDAVIAKAGRKMSGDRLARLRTLRDGLSALTDEVDDGNGPATDDDEDEEAENMATLEKAIAEWRSSTSAVDQLDTLAKARAQTDNVPYSKAYAAVLDSPAGKALYDEYLLEPEVASVAKAAVEDDALTVLAKARAAHTFESFTTAYQAVLAGPEGRAAYEAYDLAHR
jgi:hypothetical protein